MANSNLTQAKNAKNDEFYTQWADIKREVQAYLEFDPDVFRGKTILCPCDDPEWSNFTKLFALHFHDYSPKKLISTSYAVESKNYNEGYHLCAVGHDANKSKIWDSKDMDADHVKAWSQGGATDIGNCELLCKMHNRAKGNR